MSIRKTIARAIKKADRSYFFENYEKQAEAVLNALDRDGFIILPKEPKPEILKQTADSLATGKMKPEQHVRNVYQTITGLMRG